MKKKNPTRKVKRIANADQLLKAVRSQTQSSSQRKGEVPEERYESRYGNGEITGGEQPEDRYL